MPLPNLDELMSDLDGLDNSLKTRLRSPAEVGQKTPEPTSVPVNPGFIPSGEETDGEIGSFGELPTGEEAPPEGAPSEGAPPEETPEDQPPEMMAPPTPAEPPAGPGQEYPEERKWEPITPIDGDMKSLSFKSDKEGFVLDMKRLDPIPNLWIARLYLKDKMIDYGQVFLPKDIDDPITYIQELANTILDHNSMRYQQELLKYKYTKETPPKPAPPAPAAPAPAPAGMPPGGAPPMGGAPAPMPVPMAGMPM